eukprot:TRINITY_DN5704_c0_g1_i1.p1 TRINITY_DN5704_c0_g1~~TRINITY_DN5704_c0_g1_i1.p1  ORF type:complete len:474 (-),score=163.61 TRINITY_DN5704_c0_g1_i1:42-1289(-)
MLRTSKLYETPPAYVLDQPSFLNCALKIETSLEPSELLSVLKQLENEIGRVKTIRNGPRKLDLDILFYGSRIVHQEGPKIGDEDGSIHIPHLRISERDFVLGPLNDLCPHFVHPENGKTVGQMFNALEKVELTPVDYFGEEIHFDWGKRTLIMGILNVTPDSFSDGGKYQDPSSALLKAKEMIELGADIIDIGGQSTRPNADLVEVEEELRRVIPAIQKIRKELPNSIISIDTFYAKVAKESVEAGANIVNDVSGGNLDPKMFETVAQLQVPLVIMHSRGDPKTMSSLAVYENDQVYPEVKRWFRQRTEEAQDAGMYRWNIILDPGIGFAKTFAHNLQLLRSDSRLDDLGFPLLYGSSRKGFIGTITGQKEAEKRAFGTAATVVAAIQLGADIVRVHDVKEMKEVALVSDAISRV